jgi:NitT/TauT family transport system ATP-binding protein
LELSDGHKFNLWPGTRSLLDSPTLAGKMASKRPDHGRIGGIMETPNTPLLQVKGVTLQYKTPKAQVTATYRVGFDVYRSDRFILLGPSGCGKSTLLKAVGGYMTPTEGEIRLKNVPITKPGPDRMMVFQEFDQLMPWKTVRQNVAYPLKVTGKMSAAEIDAKAMHYVEKVNLTGFANSYPHTLSGGMKQRVAIARAMAMEPDILLMDEPFAALDALTRQRMQDKLISLWEETQTTLLFVTHSIPEAIKLGSRILLLSPHPGQVRAEINSVSGHDGGAEAAALARRIQEMLFADLAPEAMHA